MPTIYKIMAWWGRQAGSLLLWSWLLSTYAAVVVFTNRHKHRGFMPYVVAVLSTVHIISDPENNRRRPVRNARGLTFTGHNSRRFVSCRLACRRAIGSSAIIGSLVEPSQARQ